MTPKKGRVVVRERVSESENSTAVAANVTKTDESTRTSRDIPSAEDVLGSQSECATEEDSLLSSPSPGKPEQWELVKTWIRSGSSIDTKQNRRQKVVLRVKISLPLRRDIFCSEPGILLDFHGRM